MISLHKVDNANALGTEWKTDIHKHVRPSLNNVQSRCMIHVHIFRTQNILIKSLSHTLIGHFGISNGLPFNSKDSCWCPSIMANLTNILLWNSCFIIHISKFVSVTWIRLVVNESLILKYLVCYHFRWNGNLINETSLHHVVGADVWCTKHHVVTSGPLFHFRQVNTIKIQKYFESLSSIFFFKFKSKFRAMLPHINGFHLKCNIQ